MFFIPNILTGFSQTNFMNWFKVNLLLLIWFSIRGTVRKIADGETYKMPATIDDPAILDEIKEDLKKNNILKS